MAEYYDYVAESANDQINWGEIGKNISDMLNKQVEQRDQRREEINTATNDIVKTLNDTTILGQDQNANAWWQEGAGQLQDYLLMQNRLWKNGQLDNVTYKRNIENTKNNTNQLINIFNNYNKLNDARVKKAQAGGISGQGLFVYDNLSQFSNLTNTKMYLNPADGNMVLSQKVDKDGQIVADNNPNGIKTIAALTAAMTSDYDSFDLDKSLETPVKNFGNMITSQLGGIEGLSAEDVMSKVNDIRQNPNTKKAMDGIVNMIMNNPDNASAIYSDVVHSGIDFKELYTFDPNDGNKDRILLKLMPNGRYEAEFSTNKGKEQKAKIEEAVRARMESMISSSVDANLNPLLARIEASKAQSAAINARTKAQAQADKSNKKKQQDNSTALFDKAQVMTNVETKDANGSTTGVQQITVPLSQKFDEIMGGTPDSKGDPLQALNTVFQTIKKDGKTFSQYGLKRLPDDEKGRWRVEMTIPSVLKDANGDDATVVFYEPIDGASRMENRRVLANIYNGIVTNNTIDASQALESGNVMSFDPKEYQNYITDQNDNTAEMTGASF